MPSKENVIVKDPEILGGTPFFVERAFRFKPYLIISKAVRGSRSASRDFLLFPRDGDRRARAS